MKLPTKNEYDTIEKHTSFSEMLILSITEIVPEEMWSSLSLKHLYMTKLVHTHRKCYVL